MDIDVFKSDAKTVLEDDARLRKFAESNDMSIDFAKMILENLVGLLELPEMDEKIKEYIYADSRSDDLKSYVAGQQSTLQGLNSFTKMAVALLTVGVGMYVVFKKASSMS